MDFPQRTQLTALRSAEGDRLFWVEQRHGAMNILTASEERPGVWSSPTALTAYAEDDGMDISIHGCGHTDCTFHRGPSDDANPVHLATPPTKEFWRAAVQHGGTANATVTRIADRTIVDSAHGRLLYTQFSGQNGAAAGNLGGVGYQAFELWELNATAGGAERMLFRVKHGHCAGFFWSPDGSILAFDNQRGDHSFIGLYNYQTGGAIQWIHPSYDIDVSPSWSPSGKQLLWTRHRDMIGEDGRDMRCTGHGYCNRIGPAFSLMVVDIGPPTGHDILQPVAEVSAPREVFRDWTNGYPDSAAGYGSRGIHWVDDSELVFGSEKSGFIHAVAAPTSGDVTAGTASVRDLTPIPCDNQQWSVHNGVLYTTHNCDLVDSLGVAKVDIKLGAPSRQKVLEATNTSVFGMEGFEPLTHGVAYFECGVSYMSAIKVLQNGASLSQAIVVASGGPSAQFVTPSLVTFPAPDGTTLHAQLFMPMEGDRSESIAPELRPAVLFTHGGCQRQMYAAMHFAGGYASLYTQNQFLVSRGFVVLSVNYRGGVGYGVKFRAANGTDWEGAAEYQDVLAAGHYLQALPNVDAKRVGAYGLSYGGLNTMQALSRNSDVFAAGVANAPVRTSPFDITMRFQSVSQEIDPH